MCGICGFVIKGKPVYASSLRRMNDAIKHRGPDDEGYFSIGATAGSAAGSESMLEVKKKLPMLHPDLPINIGMGFRRLAILDLSAAGHQPMLSADKKITITFNGEIYNYKALRQELEEKGFHFESGADTEVILNGYQCWGKDVVHRLNGMFAFAIVDQHRNRLWMVRDRMGIKPLFYHQSARDITWASEMKAILKADWVTAAIQESGQVGNYYLQTTPTPTTCFQNIYALQPASWMEVDLATFTTTTHTYWQLPIGESRGVWSLQDAAMELDQRLTESVRLQLQADVPVISMMSGGIDSTTITAMGHKLDPTLDCYSMGHDGSGKGIDELPQAVAMAKKLGMKQHIHLIHQDDSIQELDAGLRHFEEPYTAPEVILNAAAFIRNQGFKVVLSGNGADELFGGYAHILGLPQWKNRRKMHSLQYLIPAIGPFLTKVKNYMQVNSCFQYYAHSRSAMRPYQIQDLFLPGHKKVIHNTLSHLEEDESKFRDPYEALFYYDLKYSVSAHHVFRDDLSAMRYGLEMRYPYLDHTLIEWVAQLPLSLRYNGRINKPLLRETAAQYIQGVNLDMPKKGFNLPIEQWWKEHKLMRDYMEQQLALLKKRNIFNNRTIEDWQRNTHSFFDLSKIWQLVTTEVWLQTYIDGDRCD